MSRDSESAKRSANLDPAARCTGKQRFTSPVLARQVAREGNRRNDRNYSAYRCLNCKGWHMGGAPKGMRRHLVAKALKRDKRATREGDDG